MLHKLEEPWEAVRGLTLPADLRPGNATRSSYWCFRHKRFRSAEDVSFHIQIKVVRGRLRL
jgi:hypothetical protein